MVSRKTPLINVYLVGASMSSWWLYIDDILLASNDTKTFLFKHFEMEDLGNASFMLGIQIHQDYSRNILGLSQKTYI